MRSNTLVLGMTIEKEVLKERVENRVDLMLKDGLENEVASLVDRYGWDAPAMNGVGYREFKDLFNGTQNITETRNRIIQSTMNLAKKQRTWFKRNNSIQWVNEKSKAVDIATTFLNKYSS